MEFLIDAGEHLLEGPRGGDLLWGTPIDVNDDDPHDHEEKPDGKRPAADTKSPAVRHLAQSMHSLYSEFVACVLSRSGSALQAGSVDAGHQPEEMMLRDRIAAPYRLSLRSSGQSHPRTTTVSWTAVPSITCDIDALSQVEGHVVPHRGYGVKFNIGPVQVAIAPRQQAMLRPSRNRLRGAPWPTHLRTPACDPLRPTTW